jgi:hypothetical protein
MHMAQRPRALAVTISADWSDFMRPTSAAESQPSVAESKPVSAGAEATEDSNCRSASASDMSLTEEDSDSETAYVAYFTACRIPSVSLPADRDREG